MKFILIFARLIIVVGLYLNQICEILNDFFSLDSYNQYIGNIIIKLL